MVGLQFTPLGLRFLFVWGFFYILNGDSVSFLHKKHKAFPPQN